MLNKLSQQSNNGIRQGLRSELVRVPEPETNSTLRNKYYTKLRFNCNELKLMHTVKVDTGASHTVISLNEINNKCIIDEIIENGVKEESLFAATGGEINIFSYIVDELALTEEIVFPCKIKIFFSDNIKRSVLGMDILSLFDFQYLKEPKQIKGTFWINNYAYVLENIEKRKINVDNDYIEPMSIADISLILNEYQNGVSEPIIITDDDGRELTDKEIMEQIYCDK